MANEPNTKTPTLDPADAALIPAGIDPSTLTADDLAELRAMAANDAVRTGAAPTEQTELPIVREATGCTSPVAISLLLEACERFGIDPNKTAQPLELAAWKFYQGSDEPGRVQPDAVVVVTAGGLKLRHRDDFVLDEATEEILRAALGLYAEDPHQPGRLIALDIPADVRLPSGALNGLVVSTDHQYPGGYLKAGGSEAAAEKQARRESRLKRLWPSSRS